MQAREILTKFLEFHDNFDHSLYFNQYFESESTIVSSVHEVNIFNDAELARNRIFGAVKKCWTSLLGWGNSIVNLKI